MSLCVAWRFQNKFCLASESCITMEAGADYRPDGIKVFQVPVRVIAVVDAQTRKHETVFQSAFGMAFAGSFLSGYLIRETVSEILFNLQYLRGRETLRFEDVCAIAFNVYRHVVNRLNGEKYGYDLDVFLMGTCPALQQCKTALFYRDQVDNELKWKMILEEAPFSYVAIGSGQDCFDVALAERRKTERKIHFAILESLQEVAKSGKIPSVAGAIQYGDVDSGGEFRLFGTIDFEKRNGQIEPIQRIRASELKAIHEGKDFGDLHVSYQFISPFTQKLQKLFGE